MYKVYGERVYIEYTSLNGIQTTVELCIPPLPRQPQYD